MLRWILLKLIQNPWYDAKGRVININLYRPQLKKNRIGEWYRQNPVFGGGYTEPDLTEYMIYESYIQGDKKLIYVDEETASEIIGKSSDFIVQKTKQRKRRHTWRIKLQSVHNFKDFKAKIISDEKAEKLLKEWGFWQEETKPESGVTP
jgi:hypothetical protein